MRVGLGIYLSTKELKLVNEACIIGIWQWLRTEGNIILKEIWLSLLGIERKTMKLVNGWTAKERNKRVCFSGKQRGSYFLLKFGRRVVGLVGSNWWRSCGGVSFSVPCIAFACHQLPVQLHQKVIMIHSLPLLATSNNGY